MKLYDWIIFNFLVVSIAFLGANLVHRYDEKNQSIRQAEINRALNMVDALLEEQSNDK